MVQTPHNRIFILILLAATSIIQPSQPADNGKNGAANASLVLSNPVMSAPMLSRKQQLHILNIHLNMHREKQEKKPNHHTQNVQTTANAQPINNGNDDDDDVLDVQARREEQAIDRTITANTDLLPPYIPKKVLPPRLELLGWAQEQSPLAANYDAQSAGSNDTQVHVSPRDSVNDQIKNWEEKMAAQRVISISLHQQKVEEWKQTKEEFERPKREKEEQEKEEQEKKALECENRAALLKSWQQLTKKY